MPWLEGIAWCKAHLTKIHHGITEFPMKSQIAAHGEENYDI
jgi:hypothetical protein